MDLVHHSVSTRAFRGSYFKVRLKVIEGEYFRLLLEVSAVIPFDHRVFNFTDSTQIAMNLHDLVGMLLVMVLIVCQYSLLGRLLQMRVKPFN